MKTVILKKGKIFGKGVFANKNFRKGEVVIRYKLKPLTQEQYKKLPVMDKHFVHSHWGVLYLYGSPERYVNHSCSPNLEVRDYCDVAIRDIKEGEELTVDYSKEDIPNLNLSCNCKSLNLVKQKILVPQRSLSGGKSSMVHLLDLTRRE